jgi:magnesium chelatase accessory protein
MVERDRLDWQRDGLDWPNRLASRFVTAGGIGWHVQCLGQGPTALLLHGTGASTHSWAGLVPHLADRFSLIMPDLPGHAFTEPLPAGRMTLPGMASAVTSLLAELNVHPRIAIGHSAGAAILIRMALDRAIAPDAIISLNGALFPFKGLAAQLFPGMAKGLFANPFAARLFSWRAARPGAVERVLAGTGSQIPDESIAMYERLFRSPDHVSAALAMMANWDLAPLLRDIPALPCRLVLMVGSNDRAVRPDQAFQLAPRIPKASVQVLRGLGHLMHEEQPLSVAERIIE